MGSQLVPNPIQGRTNVDTNGRLTGHVSRTHRQIEVLDEEQDVGDELYPFANALVSGRIALNGNQERCNLGTISIPGIKYKSKLKRN